MSLPKVGKDANGLPTLIGVEERQLTQNQADYSDTLKAAQLVTGPQGENLRSLLKTNPTASAGVITGLAKAGAMPNNALVDTLIQIDKQTQTQRQLDIKKESNRLSTEKFNNTPVGMVWSGIKGLVRGLSVVGQTGLEVVSTPMRQAYKDLQEGNTPENKQLGSFYNESAKNFRGQTTLYQIVKQQIQEGKIDLGAGFFPSEETGAGFAARTAQMKEAKVAFEVGGKIYYRPYSVFDPAAYLLTVGHPESAAARVITALGDIGLSVVTDPTIAVGKLKQAAKLAQLASEGSTGLKAAKAAKEASLLKSQLDEATQAVESSLKQVHGASAVTKEQKTAAYLKNYQTLAKVKDQYNKINIDYDGIASFLSGSQGTHIIDTIVNIDDWQKIQRLAKGRLTVEEAVLLAKATTREEALSAIAPFIADGKVMQRALETGSTTTRALSGIVKGVSPRATQVVNGWQASSRSREPIHKLLLGISNKYHAYVPDKGGTLVHITDKDKLVEVVNGVARSLKLDNATIKTLLDDIALSTDATTSGYTASAKLFDAIYAKNASKFTGEQLDKFKKLTRTFETERKDTAAYWAEQHAKGTEITFMISKGKSVTIHSSHLDSELLNSFVYIPSGEEISKFILSAKKFGDIGVKLDEATTFGTSLWKKSVMLRPAYITRNIAEEQIRVFASGHSSFFNHPISAIAMFLGQDGGPKWRSILNQFDKVRNDVHGNGFKMASQADELKSEEQAMALLDPYVDFMGNSLVGAGGDGEINKILRNLGYQKEVFGHPLWWDGFSNQLRILHNSEFVQQVLATKPGQEMRTVDYFLNKGGRKTLDYYLHSKDELTKEALTTKDGLMKFLFKGKNAGGQEVSVLARIEELAGAGGKSSSTIKKLLSAGKIKVGNQLLEIPGAKKAAENSIKNSSQISKGRKSLNDAQAEFTKQVKEAFDGTGNWDNVKMTVPTQKFQRVGGKGNVFSDVTNKFFDYAVKMEKLTTMGPEWRQSYWDAIHNILGALDEKAILKLREEAPKSLGPLRNPITGNNIGRTHPAWKRLEIVKGDGNITLDEAHQYAANVANKKVADLFYNAGKRRLLFHQLRLVAPFAQAWWDTIHAWSGLAMENPLQVYKATKALDWLSSADSSALYELTDAKDYYDANQGFFFKDPTTGERKFFMPLAGAALNLFQGMSGHPRVSGPFALSATPQSFNFALGGGSVLPGFGPGVSISAALLDSMDKNPMKFLPAGIEEEAYRVLFPYGTPDIKNSGVLNSALLSSNWSRILSSAAGVEPAFAGAFAPSMTYLANSGEYNLDDPMDQKRLTKDSYNLAKYFTMWRGVFGAFMPIPFSLRPEALAKSKDGNTVLATSLWADFKNLEANSGSNRNRAYADFLDTYGPEQIFAIINTTTNQEPTNLPTYNLIKNDPSVLNKYPDVYGMFYPNGELSQALYRYQQQRGSFTKLTPKEIMQKATQIRYYAALDRLRTRSTAENWSSSDFKAASQSLSKSFEQLDLTFNLDTGKRTRIINQLKAAVADESLADSDALTGMRDYLYLRDKAIEASGMKTLSNASSEPQRTQLAQEAAKILQRNPDFQKLFYTYFKSELEG
jgi:hypothetical protein